MDRPGTRFRTSTSWYTAPAGYNFKSRLLVNIIDDAEGGISQLDHKDWCAMPRYSFMFCWCIPCSLVRYSIKLRNSSEYPITILALYTIVIFSTFASCCSSSQFCQSNPRTTVSTSAMDRRSSARIKEKLFTSLDESLFLTGSCHWDGQTIFDVVLF